MKRFLAMLILVCVSVSFDSLAQSPEVQPAQTQLDEGSFFSGVTRLGGITAFISVAGDLSPPRRNNKNRSDY
jgi:hypothetical protein